MVEGQSLLELHRQWPNSQRMSLLVSHSRTRREATMLLLNAANVKILTIWGDFSIEFPPPTHTHAYTHPEHAIPETVSLQVVCNSQMSAQSEFIYYASAQCNSDMLFQYSMSELHWALA